MKFELTRNYKLAFKLLNENVILAAWLDWNRDRVVASIRKIHGVILINKNAAYLPTIYDDFEKQCNQFNIEFLIPEDEVKKDLRDRSRNSPCKSLHELRELMGTEKEAIVHETIS